MNQHYRFFINSANRRTMDSKHANNNNKTTPGRNGKVIVKPASRQATFRQWISILGLGLDQYSASDIKLMREAGEIDSPNTLLSLSQFQKAWMHYPQSTLRLINIENIKLQKRTPNLDENSYIVSLFENPDWEENADDDDDAKDGDDQSLDDDTESSENAEEFTIPVERDTMGKTFAQWVGNLNLGNYDKATLQQLRTNGKISKPDQLLSIGQFRKAWMSNANRYIRMKNIIGVDIDSDSDDAFYNVTTTSNPDTDLTDESQEENQKERDGENEDDQGLDDDNDNSNDYTGDTDDDDDVDDDDDDDNGDIKDDDDLYTEEEETHGLFPRNREYTFREWIDSLDLGEYDPDTVRQLRTNGGVSSVNQNLKLLQFRKAWMANGNRYIRQMNINRVNTLHVSSKKSKYEVITGPNPDVDLEGDSSESQGEKDNDDQKLDEDATEEKVQKFVISPASQKKWFRDWILHFKIPVVNDMIPRLRVNGAVSKVDQLLTVAEFRRAYMMKANNILRPWNIVKLMLKRSTPNSPGETYTIFFAPNSEFIDSTAEQEDQDVDQHVDEEENNDDNDDQTEEDDEASASQNVVAPIVVQRNAKEYIVDGSRSQSSWKWIQSLKLAPGGDVKSVPIVNMLENAGFDAKPSTSITFDDFKFVWMDDANADLRKRSFSSHLVDGEENEYYVQIYNGNTAKRYNPFVSEGNEEEENDDTSDVIDLTEEKEEKKVPKGAKLPPVTTYYTFYADNTTKKWKRGPNFKLMPEANVIQEFIKKVPKATQFVIAKFTADPNKLKFQNDRSKIIQTRVWNFVIPPDTLFHLFYVSKQKTKFVTFPRYFQVKGLVSDVMNHLSEIVKEVKKSSSSSSSSSSSAKTSSSAKSKATESKQKSNKKTVSWSEKDKKTIEQWEKLIFGRSYFIQFGRPIDSTRKAKKEKITFKIFTNMIEHAKKHAAVLSRGEIQIDPKNSSRFIMTPD
jgi:hypothetical protein